MGELGKGILKEYFPIPSLLAKDNKKLIYGPPQKDGRSKGGEAVNSANIHNLLLKRKEYSWFLGKLTLQQSTFKMINILLSLGGNQ